MIQQDPRLYFDGPYGRVLYALVNAAIRGGAILDGVGNGSAYLRLPSGRRIRIADHPPVHSRSMSRVADYIHPKRKGCVLIDGRWARF